MSNNNKSQCSNRLKCNSSQAKAILRLCYQPEWAEVKELIQSRFTDAQQQLELSDETSFKKEQGRLQELRFVLDLESSAKAHLDNMRNRKRTPAIE